jgi:hypothetical protein
MGLGRLIFLPAKHQESAAEERMEAKVRELITLKNECEFFDLIEKKMKEQGFEVLETLALKAEKKPNEASQSHAVRFVVAHSR